MCKHLWGQYCDIGVVVGALRIVRSPRESVCFILLAGYVFQNEVVISELLDISRYTSVDVVGFFVILKVFVVCEHGGGEGGAEEEMAPVG